jgi:G:T-mismatch repair DNA endonuclease (very short patch repair protein)
MKERTPWNKGLTKEDAKFRASIEKGRETQKRRYANGELKAGGCFVKGNPAWNKGLTKEMDFRVGNYSGKNHWTARTGRSPLPKGSTKSPEWKEKIRIKRLEQVIPVRDTKPEVTVQNFLRDSGIIFRKHIPIKGFCQPDIVIEPNICIFVDGDYWHSFPRAIVRDKEVNNFLLKNNFKVIRLWEHEIDKNENNCLGNLVEEIKSCSR